MLPSDPIFKIDDSFVWINLRRYNRQQLKNNELAEDIATQVRQDLGIESLIQGQILLFDSMYEGHNRDDYDLAQQNLAKYHWYSFLKYNIYVKERWEKGDRVVPCR